MLKALYKYAQTVCSSLPDMYRDDVIQESVLYAWGQTKRYKYTTKAFLMKAVRLRVRRKRKTYINYYPPGVELAPEHIVESSTEAFILPVVAGTEPFMESLLANNFNVQQTARDLGIKRMTAQRQWKNLARAVREEYELDC